MHYSTSLPELKLLSTPCLVPHEETDPRRVEKLCARLQEEGRLKNPPVVASIPGTERYVILDGANRVMSFLAMGIPHITAQLVSYADPGVLLESWNHVVCAMSIAEFENALSNVSGLMLRSSSLSEAREALATNQAAAYIVCDTGIRIIASPEGFVVNDIHLLNRIVNAYTGRADIIRASNDVWEIQKPCYPNVTALVVFPRYSPSDILMVAKNGDRVPTGVTRHIITNRALNVNIPISILAADWDIERKQTWLQEWYMERLSANAVRYYAEATFTFDE